MKDPLLAPAVAFVAGILLSRGVRFETWECWIEAALFAGLAVLAGRQKSRRVSYISALIAVGLSGVLVDVLHRPGRLPTIDAGSQEVVLLSGCVVEPSIFYRDRDQFTLELAPHARVRVTIALKDGEIPPDIPYGRQVEVEAKVRAIRNFGNPGSFDFVTYSARRGFIGLHRRGPRNLSG